jgi:hypothetical protein
MSRFRVYAVEFDPGDRLILGLVKGFEVELGRWEEYL